MADEEQETFLNRESVEVFCYSALAVTSTVSFILLRREPHFKYATSALFHQTEFAFWVLIGKVVEKRSEENAEDMRNFVAELAEATTFHFNLPLIAAQSFLLSVVDSEASATTSDILASAPFLCYVVRVLAGDGAYMCVDLTVKAASLAVLYYSTHNLGYPHHAYLFTVMYLGEAVSYWYSPRSVTLAIMSVNDIFFLSWLLGFSKI